MFSYYFVVCLMHFFTEIRGALRLHSGYFAFRYCKDPRAHGASWGKRSPFLSYFSYRLGATQKRLKTHFSQTHLPNCSADGSQPRQVPPKGEPKPAEQSAKHTRGPSPLVGQQTAGFGTAQLLQHQEGLCSMWNTLRTVLSSYSSFLPSRVFLVLISTTWFPATLKKWYNKWL